MQADTGISSDIVSRAATVGVVGLGVAGLYQAIEFVISGFSVVGYDSDPAVPDAIALGDVKATDIPGPVLREALDAGTLVVTGDPADLAPCRIVVIAVPTGLDSDGAPDTTCVSAAVDQLAKVLHPPVLVVMKSTAYPGMTRRLVVEPLTGHLGTVGHDWFAAYAPERGDPGNRELRQTLVSPRVVSGASPACRDLVSGLYRSFGATVHVASSIDAAEVAKLHENVYRFVNISYANELDAYCRALGVESAEVIRLAATKSLGFTPFFPGVGVGGMYVPVNPHYMLASAPADVQLNTVRGAMNTNTRRPVVLAESVAKALTRPVSGSRLLVLGAAYKPNSRDFRNSAALRLCEELQARGASVRVVEPMIGGDLIAGFPLVPLDEHQVQWADAVICVVAHDAFAGAAELTGAKPLINL